MKELNDNSGITLIALIITVIVIMILAGISINAGTSLIKRANVESLMTNMITIKANAKVYAEEVNAEIWDLGDDMKKAKRAEIFTSEKYDMEIPENIEEIKSKIDSSIIPLDKCEPYNITNNTLEIMGLSNLANDTQEGEFIVVFNSDDFTKLEVVYMPGINFENTKYYTLSELQSKIEE